MTLYVKEVIVIILSYLLGGFSTGYFLVRFFKGEDVRNVGSRAVGATNVGRVLGKKGFLITFLGDALKGMIVSGSALYLNLNPWGVVLAILAVVVGHILPLQLDFRGGKGIATAVGALLILDYKLILVVSLFFVITIAITRLYTFSGLFAFALSPVVAFILGRPQTHVNGLVILVVFILIAHRKNIRELLINNTY